MAEEPSEFTINTQRSYSVRSNQLFSLKLFAMSKKLALILAVLIKLVRSNEILFIALLNLTHTSK